MRIFLGLLFIWSAAAFASAVTFDPFDFLPSELLIQNGPLKGQMLKGDRRPVLRLSPIEVKRWGLPDLGPRVLWVANFLEQPKAMRDRKKFHIAAIPLDAIDHVVEEVADRTIYNPYGKTFWQRLASVGPHFHAQTYFYFNRDVLLFSQEADPQSFGLASVEPVQRIREMAFAVGAARPESFDPSMAIGGAYRRINLLVGHAEAHRDLVGGTPIQRFSIGLSPQKAAELLELLADESTRIRATQPYNAMKDGCLSTTLRYIDQVLFTEPVRRFALSWPIGPEAVMAEFAVRGIPFDEIEPLMPRASAREIKEKGDYGPGRLHPYGHVARGVGRCASIISRLITGSSLRLSRER